MNACAQCAAADPQSLCSGCLVRYCSAACQRAHWVAHKPACVSAGAVIVAPLAAALAHCTCAVMPRSPWRPSREDERAGPEAYVVISAGNHCRLSHKGFAYALSAALAARPTLPPAVAARVLAAHPTARTHARLVLKHLVIDFDGDWHDAFNGRGCSASLVCALLELGADAHACDSFNEWSTGCARPYSMPAFAVSEAFDALKAKTRVRAEKFIAIAAALLAAGAPADAPAAVATWDAPLADKATGAAGDSVVRALEAFYGAPRMPIAPPCSTLHLASCLRAAVPPLSGAHKLHALVFEQTPAAHRRACPKPDCRGACAAFVGDIGAFSA